MLKSLLPSFLLVLTSCGSAQQSAQLPTDPTGSFRPIDPVDVNDYWDERWDMDADKDGKISIQELFGNFPNEAVRVSVRNIDSSGEMQGYGASSSVKGGRYEVTVDYVKYRTDPHLTGEKQGLIVQSGVGIRLRARITTFEAGLNITSLFGIGAAAKSGQLTGTLEFETIGIGGKAISPLVPLPSEISMESIQNAMQAAAAIKASMYSGEDDVKIVAQVFGEKSADPNVRFMPSSPAKSAPPGSGPTTGEPVSVTGHE